MCWISSTKPKITFFGGKWRLSLKKVAGLTWNIFFHARVGNSHLPPNIVLTQCARNTCFNRLIKLHMNSLINVTWTLAVYIYSVYYIFLMDHMRWMPYFILHMPSRLLYHYTIETLLQVKTIYTILCCFYNQCILGVFDNGKGSSIWLWSMGTVLFHFFFFAGQPNNCFYLFIIIF